jgi:murein DD-endopeptidase MepM/ murein hydrolase activator NlpD
LAISGLAVILATLIFIGWILFLENRGDEPDGRLSAGDPGNTPNSLAALDPALLSRPLTPGPSATGMTTAGLPPDNNQGPDTTHTVQPGETLFRISLTYEVPIETIMALNGLSDPSLIQAGQVLVLPAAAALAQQVSSPWPTVTASPTLTPTNTATPTLTPTPEPPRVTDVNGLPLEAFFFMDEKVQANVQDIYARGQEIGRNLQAYSKVGDSTIENPHFLARFDEGPYNLGQYVYLQGTIDHFAGSHGRQGLAVHRGLHSWTVTDPLWADKSVCLANESPLACEIRLHNPAYLIVRLGSNDRGVPAGFEQNLRLVVQYAIDNGVIPLLGTKADRFEGSNINNDIIRRVAADLQVPLWDFDLIAATIPGRGLDVDQVHLTTFYAHDYTSSTAYQRGHGVHNLTALMVLEQVWREIRQGLG